MADGAAEILVENDGPLLADDGDRLIESLVSIRQKKTEHVHLGLGLTIVRLIAEFHDGDVAMRNRDSGDGVVVKILIPLAVSSLGYKLFKPI